MNPDITKLQEQLKKDFIIDRETDAYKSVFTNPNPLVTVTIATFNKCKTLLEYSLKSVLDQTYKNLEIIVVGDRCTDNTEESVKNIKDSRIQYYAMTERPEYPGFDGSYDRWLVAGAYPFNFSLGITTGDFLTHLDDDDAFKPERIEKLIKFMQENKYDAIHHPFSFPNGPHNSPVWELNNVTTSALFMHGWFKRTLADPLCYIIPEPGDWNRCKRIRDLGAKIGRYPEILTHKLK